MPKGKRVVVDASVARSAGSGEKANEFSLPSRAVLDAVADHHWIAFSQEGLDEWRRHRRQFSGRWLQLMIGKKRVLFLGDTKNDHLRSRLGAACALVSEKRAILKDAHLVEAACQTDRIVISRDETVRDLFRRACHQVQEIHDVCWANPEIEDERVADWLISGARSEVARKLGS
ncbi:MAG TPA: hypothetical protein VIW92_01160 [Thermoanaerobaculia bacterium]